MQIISRLPTLAALGGLLTCSLVFGAGFNAKNVKPSGLTVAQAEQVLRVVLKHERYKTYDRRLWIDGPWLTEGMPSIPGYHSFGVVYIVNTQGHYSINIFTGDVWQTESCERYSFPALMAIQERIALKTGKKLASDDDARSDVGCP